MVRAIHISNAELLRRAGNGTGVWEERRRAEAASRENEARMVAIILADNWAVTSMKRSAKRLD